MKRFVSRKESESCEGCFLQPDMHENYTSPGKISLTQGMTLGVDPVSLDRQQTTDLTSHVLRSKPLDTPSHIIHANVRFSAKISFWTWTTWNWTWSESRAVRRREPALGFVLLSEERQTAQSAKNPMLPTIPRSSLPWFVWHEQSSSPARWPWSDPTDRAGTGWITKNQTQKGSRNMRIDWSRTVGKN